MFDSAGTARIASYGGSGSGVQAVQKAAELQPDLILLDIGIPELDGIKTALTVFEVSPRSKIMFLSQNNDGGVVQAALATGASAYVHKVDAGRELLTGVETVLEGGSFVSGGRSIDRIGSESIANRPDLKTPNPGVTAMELNLNLLLLRNCCLTRKAR